MKNIRKSISYQIPIIFIVSYLIIALVIVLIVYNRFETRMVNEYTKMAEGVTNLMLNAYDTEKTDIFIEENFENEDYIDLLLYYYTLKDNYPDIYYMYVYQFAPNGEPTATVILDLDEYYQDPPLQESIDWIGSTYELDEPFASEIDKILNGKDPVVHTVHTQDGEYLLSYVRPIFDEDGNYVCSACVDFSMAEVHEKDLEFLFKMMSVLGLLMFIILILNIKAISKKVTSPLNKISGCIDSFVYDTEADRFENVQRLESLNITQNDEIGVLFTNFVSNMQESLYYMSNYNKAKGEIEYKDKEIEKISEMTFTDSMTHAHNKTSYENDSASLDEKIRTGLSDISAVMVDINNLKYINDTFGHEIGDSYIIGCFNIVRDIYANSTIYRIGGDEFVILLTGDDYFNRHSLYYSAIKAFEKSFESNESDPAKKYSASIGMSDYEAGDTVHTLVKKADKAMYENKVAFKKKH
nr:GGDEF domain-containing protein [Lachnospiraceae bacterium]